VFNCLLDIPKDFFTLGELNKFVPRLKKIFPHNYNIEAKIRQQLQNLRDIGLVQFLGKGNYQKLWK
ncbi:MAG: restriction endonuclease, partial [Ignavibacteriales bacterium]